MKKNSYENFLNNPKARINPATNKPFQFGEWYYKDDGTRWGLRSIETDKTVSKGIHAGKYQYRFEEKYTSKIEHYRKNAELLKKVNAKAKYPINHMTNEKWKKGDKHRLGFIFEKYETDYVTNDGFYYCAFKTYPKDVLNYIPRTLLRFKQRNMKKFGKESNLTIAYLLWIFPLNMICPVTNKKMHIGSPRNNNNVSLDRIDNEKGYEIGNVIYVSLGVNVLKSDKAYDLMKRTVEFYEAKMSTREK